MKRKNTAIKLKASEGRKDKRAEEREKEDRSRRGEACERVVAGEIREEASRLGERVRRGRTRRE